MFARRSFASYVLVFITVLLVFGATRPSESVGQARDVSYTKEVHLKIGDQRSLYKLEGHVVETVTPITERAAQLSSWHIPEPFYTTISDVDVEVGSEDLRDDDIERIVADQGDVFISGTKTYVITFPSDVDVRDGFRIEYDIEYKNVAYMPRLDLPDLSGDARLVVTIDHPASLTVKPEVITADAGVSMTTQTPSAEETRVVLRADEARPNRPFDAFPSARAAVRFSISAEDALLTPSTPQSFSDWYMRLLPSTGAVPDSSLHEIVEGATSRLDTVKALYDFVRKDVRYLSTLEDDGPIVPRPPQDVLENRFGDCKDKSFFVYSAAKQFGIDVRMVLVPTSPLPEFEYPHIHSFNHVINAMDVDGKWVFFDGTYANVPFGAIAPKNQDRRALILGGDAFWHQTGRTSTAELSIEIDASLDNVNRGSARLTFTGAMLAPAIDAIDSASRVTRENALSELVGPWLYRMQLENFVVVESADTAVTVSADADLSRFVVASSSRAYVPATALRIARVDATDRADDGEPLLLPMQPGIDLTLRLRAETYTVAADSFVATAHDGETYRAVVSPATRSTTERDALDPATRSTIQYSYRPGPRHVAGKQRTEFLTFTRNVLSAKREMFVFSAQGDSPD